MTEFLVYDAKVAVLVAVFYLFYRLLLAHETLHRLNRLVLLGTAVVSMVLPLCVITVHRTVLVPVTSMETEETALAPSTMVAGEAAAEPVWPTVLGVVFFLGVALVLLKTILSVVKVCILIHKSELHPQPDGITLAVCSQDLAPFSWMHYIVLSRRDYDSPDAAILAHERAHIRLKHSWDVMLVDLLTAWQWFNPAMWQLRADLRSIHEFEADAAVLSQGIDARQYQYLLVRKAMATGGYSVVNSIGHSTLKKRINMMLKHKSNALSALKVLYVIPLVMAALAVNARTVTVFSYVQEKVAPAAEAVTVQETVAPEAAAVEMPVAPIAAQPVAEEAEMPVAPVVSETPAVAEAPAVEAVEGEPFLVKGKVVDEKNEPVIGAAVLVEGSTYGTVTDMSGQFSMKASEGDVLVISYIGMGSAKVKVVKDSADKPFSVVLKKDGSDAKEKEDNKVIVVTVDGKGTTVQEMNRSLSPDEIQSITVEKNASGVHEIKVSTKKK
ncbi:MAG: carboxypeptidase-like regulatory domain-containing protein [Bacteroidaceae bacterium]|nr:carboxypeptidase-like regulatory domain-containing protein [Bacteroidaceae bacterium]